MALIDHPAQLFQPLGDVGRTQVGTAHPVSQAQQQFGNARHANAADADEVDVFGFSIHEGTFCCLSQGSSLLLLPGSKP